jgi:WD40 repeat protein
MLQLSEFYNAHQHTHNCTIHNICVSPDEKHVVCATRGYDLHVWDISSGLQVRSLQGNVPNAKGLVWSSDGQYIASWGSGMDMRAWTPNPEVSHGLHIHFHILRMYIYIYICIYMYMMT